MIDNPTLWFGTLDAGHAAHLEAALRLKHNDSEN